MVWHLSKFSGSELIEFAVEVEKKGEKFYNSLAEKCDDDKASELFQFLAKEEAKHQLDFSKLGEKLKEFNARESFEGEYLEYVQSLVSSHMFNRDLDTILDKISTTEDAIDFAINFEKDSIVFFIEFKNMVNASEAHVIEELIGEERKHIKKLTALK
ncbi:rubrerythrin [Desulfitispora alkaliphila]|uniref:ferritin-like domain-containing protein n=1 Tax=Desulfitispora alkaliphila TaxID=622674 RepID=UPI003D1E3C3C